MSTRKLAAGLAALTLCLAGCGGEDTEPESTAAAAEETTEAEETESEEWVEPTEEPTDEETEEELDGFGPVPPQPQDVTESILTGADLYAVNPCLWVATALEEGEISVTARVGDVGNYAPYSKFVTRISPHYYMNYTDAGYAYTHIAECGTAFAEQLDELEHDDPSFHLVAVQEGQVDIYDRDFAKDNNIDIIDYNGRIGQCVTRERCVINLDAEHYLDVSFDGHYASHVPQDYTADDVIKPLLLALTDVLDNPDHADIFSFDPDEHFHAKVCGALDVDAISDFFGEELVLSEVDAKDLDHVECNFAPEEGSELVHLSVYFFTGPDTNRTDEGGFEDSGMIVGEMRDDDFDECEPEACFGTLAVAQQRLNKDLVYSMDIGTDDVVPPKTSKEDRLALYRALRPAMDMFQGQ